MRSRVYGLGIIVLLVGACLLGAAPRASAQDQPQPAAVATDEATLNAAQSWGNAPQSTPVTSPLNFRRWRWGVEGGVTNAGISYDKNLYNPDRRWGGVIGTYFELDCEECRFEFLMDLLYDTKGAKFPLGNDMEILGLKELEFLPSLRYMVYSTPSVGVHVGVGPSIDLRVSERHTLNDQTLNVADFTTSSDFGVSAMVGASFREKWSACIRYTQGVTNIIATPGTGNLTAHNNSLQFYLGYRMGKFAF